MLCLIRSQIKESATFCSHIFPDQLHINSTQKWPDNAIIWLFLLLLCHPKGIQLSGNVKSEFNAAFNMPVTVYSATSRLQSTHIG